MQLVQVSAVYPQDNFEQLDLVAVTQKGLVFAVGQEFG
jgi:hypothetical protein